MAWYKLCFLKIIIWRQRHRTRNHWVTSPVPEAAAEVRSWQFHPGLQGGRQEPDGLSPQCCIPGSAMVRSWSQEQEELRRRDRGRERESTYPLIHSPDAHSGWDWPWPGRNWELGIQHRSPMWMSGTHVLEPSLLLCKVCIIRKLESRAAGRNWNQQVFGEVIIVRKEPWTENIFLASLLS